MKNITWIQVTLLFVTCLSGININAQGSVEELETKREVLAKMQELNDACDATPGCQRYVDTPSIDYVVDGWCRPPWGTLRTYNTPPSDICDYSLVVRVQKYKPNGDPVCYVLRHTWSGVHCLQ